MIKNLFTLCFLFLSIHNFSQDIETMKSIARFSSDSELTGYIDQAKSRGLSLLEVEGLISAQGASLDELQKLRTLWNADSASFKSYTIDNDLSVSSQSSLGFSNKNKTKITRQKSRRFGSDFFTNLNINEAPQLFIATPSDYRLGPGDELIINLFGASENYYSVRISRDGTVKFDRIAPIYLSGLSIKSAKNRLKNRLSKLYAGLVSDDPLNKVGIDVSLKKARSIVVNISGQVVAPGTYTISGFSSILNALFAAGGPNEIGSYRNIKLIRNGKVNNTIDLYNYFVSGLYPSIYLRDQDVILVEAYRKQIDLESGFKTNGLFELNQNENLDDILKFSGGFLSNSYKDKIFVNRINSSNKSLVEFSKEEFSKSQLIDGDILSARTVSDYIENSVSIEGAVNIPGKFDLSKAKTVNQLISSAQGLSPDAISNAILFRNNNGIENEIISINLSNEDDLAINLVNQDRLMINSSKDVDVIYEITVNGEVNKPGKIQYKKGMTIRDAIVLSAGFNLNADKSNISIIRNISSENKLEYANEFYVSFDEDLNPQNNFELLPDDIISVKKIPYLKNSKFFGIQGQVAIPGFYSILSANYNIKDAFNEHVELLNTSSLNGIFVLRDGIKIPVKISYNSYLDYTVESALELRSGDIIEVPELNNTVSVYGEVQQETIVIYNKSDSFKDVISSAGGFLENADKKRAYIEYQNGLKKSSKQFLWFRNYPKVLPGSKIFIPLKKERSKTSVAEIVGYTTSLVSIFALIKSL